jgi:predicted nucleic acid-binding protein
MLMVDSTVWIDYFNGVRSPHTERLDALLDQDLILVGDLILAEALQGFRRDEDFAQAYQALNKFAQVSIVSPELAVKSAQNFRRLRQKGLTVRKTIDSLIATWCIENDVPLLHHDQNFDLYAILLGLRVVSVEGSG